MKQIISLLFLFSVVFGGSYYAKIEPIYKYTIASSAAGEIKHANESQEGKIAKDEIIKIDDELDRANYELLKVVYENLKAIYESKLSIYEKIEAMTTKSQIEKENEKITMLTAKNNMLNAKLQLEELEDRLLKKTIRNDGLYIYKIFVKEGDFVNLGAKLVELHDVSASRLVIYVDKDDIDNIKKKKILVNGKPNLYKIDKAFMVADSEFISNYRVELVGPAVKKFSEIAVIEILKEGK
ncbi:MAG: hypothetical protein QG567_1631 [Campylobacterota bacterium]|nr:hypothetical protein [Campylobacterota bacterium]